MANTLSCSIVSSRLDYCNALLYGMTQKNFNSLQRIQNSLAKVVCNAPYRSPPQPLLKSLHWLPVIEHVEYKLAAMTYKVLLHHEPSSTHRPIQTSSNSTVIKLYLGLMFHLSKLLQLLVRSAFLPKPSGIAYHLKSESHLHSLNSCADSRGISFSASFADHSYPAPLYNRLN